MTQQFFLMIPQEILSNQDLSPSEKMVLAYIAGFTRVDKECFATAATIGALLGMHEITVRKCRSRLIKLGFVFKNEEANRVYYWADPSGNEVRERSGSLRGGVADCYDGVADGYGTVANGYGGVADGYAYNIPIYKSNNKNIDKSHNIQIARAREAVGATHATPFFNFNNGEGEE